MQLRKMFVAFLSTTVLLFSFTLNANASCQSCELHAKKLELENELSIAKNNYDQEPTQENLQRLSDIHQQLQVVSLSLDELQQTITNA